MTRAAEDLQVTLLKVCQAAALSGHREVREAAVFWEGRINRKPALRRKTRRLTAGRTAR